MADQARALFQLPMEAAMLLSEAITKTIPELIVLQNIVAMTAHTCVGQCIYLKLHHQATSHVLSILKIIFSFQLVLPGQTLLSMAAKHGRRLILSALMFAAKQNTEHWFY